MICIGQHAVQDFGHTQHPIQGRADFMAHIGKEHRLGATGLFGPRLGQIKLCHIRTDAAIAREIAGFVKDWLSGHPSPAHNAVGGFRRAIKEIPKRAILADGFQQALPLDTNAHIRVGIQPLLLGLSDQAFSWHTAIIEIFAIQNKAIAPLGIHFPHPAI